jgi:hypothetical protein
MIKKFIKMLEMIEEKANEKMLSEDPNFDPNDFSGGNFDDAFNNGMEDGQIAFATDLLNAINGWNNIK